MEKEYKKGRWVVAVVAAVTMLVLSGFIWNTSLFVNMLDHVSEQYISNTNQQLAAHISNKMEAGQEFIKDFADTVSRMPEFLLTEELLNRKKDAMDLEELLVISRDGNVLPANAEKQQVIEWMEENPDAMEAPLISYIQDKGILFTAPVIKEGEPVKLIAGLQSYHDLQLLVHQTDSLGIGFSVIFDREKEKRIIAEGHDITSAQRKNIRELLIESEKKNLCHDVFKDTVTGGTEVYVAVTELEDCNWIQASVIPADFLLEKISKYMDLYTLLVILIIFLFVFLIRRLKKENFQRERLYYTDPVTGGYNREGFLSQSMNVLNEKELANWAVVYLNVVDFRYINESWSEADGNRTLKFINKCFQESLKKDELVCRSGMDHFFLLLNEKCDQAVIRRVQKVIEDMNSFINRKFAGSILQFTVGGCWLEEKGDLSALMNKAVFASRQTEEKNVCNFFEGRTSELFERETRLNRMFEKSLKDRDFLVYLQPKVPGDLSRHCQAEALVRWNHPEEGMISPGEFIPILEKSDRICKLDLYMFEEICCLVAGWLHDKKTVTRISVNVSRAHLRQSGINICREYQEIKERYQIPDGIIELELTETMLLEDNQLTFVKNILDGFRSLGLQTALDDFGFAYSSLALLKDFEVDVLKLDRAFFVNETEKSRSIVENIVRLAHSLNMEVVAEGIEQAEQVLFLRQIGCDLIQGYVYSRPLPIEEFESWRDSGNYKNTI